MFSKINKMIINDPINNEYKIKGYNPIYSANKDAKILIIGQAPGIKAQTSEKLFKDKSGITLRQWLGVDEKTFYNDKIFAILPMDFYYPGKGKNGDLPPRIEFAKKWHPLLISEMKNIELIILVGNYAIKYYLENKYQLNLTKTVKAYKDYLPKYFPIVHPSPLNFRWHKLNPWFREEVILDLKIIVKTIINN